MSRADASAVDARGPERSAWDWLLPAGWSRHPSDLLRLFLGLALVVVAALPVRADSITRWETAVFRVVNDLPLPGWTEPGVWLVMQLGVIGAVPVVAVLALATRRVRLALDAVVAAGSIYLVAKVIKDFVQRGRPETLLDQVNILGEPARGLGFVSGHSAVAVALATVASPYLGRRGRRVAWGLALAVCLARVYVGAHLPLDVLGGAALGWMAGALVHLLLGVPDPRPSRARVTEVLAEHGFEPGELVPVAPGRNRSSHFLADGTGEARDDGAVGGEARDDGAVSGEATGVGAVSGEAFPEAVRGLFVGARGGLFVGGLFVGGLFVKVVAREWRDTDLIYRAWRAVLGRRARRRRHGSPVNEVEHEAAMAMLAAQAGVRTPRVLLVRGFGNGAGLLVQERVDGRPLAELPPDRRDGRLAEELHRQVALLHAAGLVHGELTPDNVLVDAAGDPWLVDFDQAEPSRDERALAADLVTLAKSLGELPLPAPTGSRPDSQAPLDTRGDPAPAPGAPDPEA